MLISQLKHQSEDELVAALMETLSNFTSISGELEERGYKAASLLSPYFYKPSAKLSELIIELKEYIKLKNPSKVERENAGNLMEKIAFLSLSGLKGIIAIKSFQSVSAQYDLLVNGDEKSWEQIFSTMKVKDLPKGILVEAKAYAKPIEDKHFSRLCNLIQLNLEKSIGIGIFFTINGATGFPKRNGVRKRTISDCWFRQVLFYAKTNKPIIVLDSEDIFTLDKNGSLITLLERKIGEIEKLTGLPTESEQLIDVDLPAHLSTL
jgi:hypothetical protein